MKEYLRVMSAESVKSILRRQKTETRQVLIPQPPRDLYEESPGMWVTLAESGVSHGPWRLPVPGDQLLIREPWGVGDSGGYLVDPCLNYRADGAQRPIDPTFLGDELRVGRFKPRDGWRPARLMYHWAIRIRLEVIIVSVERIQEMHGSACAFAAEGVELPKSELFPQINRASKLEAIFVRGWDKLNAKRGVDWQSNPWVYVTRFRLLRVEEGMIKPR